MYKRQDVDRLEGRSLSAFFYNVIGKMDEKLTQEKQEAYAARVKYDAAARELAGIEEDLHLSLIHISSWRKQSSKMFYLRTAPPHRYRGL